MERFCDLHTHSYFSDGTDTPAQLIENALALGLGAVALTDHNTVDGLPDLLRAAEGKPIRAIPGAEFSVDYNGTELHLLGLFLDPCHYEAINTMMADVIRRKEESNIDLVNALNRAGYRLDYADVKALSPTGKVNRSHIARRLAALGYTQTPKEAFDTLLDPKFGYYKEPKRLTVWEMIRYLCSIQAVPVLAHPFLNLSEEALRVFLPEAKAQGLAGMETAYSTYSPETARLAESMAEEFGLLKSGGSDYHGTGKADIQLGRGRGSLAVPLEWLDALQAFKAQSA